MQQQSQEQRKQMIPENGIVVQNITIRPIHRQSQDIGKWRTALAYAEATNGRRVQLYDLYEEILLDGVLSSLLEKRVLGVTKNKLLFVDKEGKEIAAVTELLKLRNFRELRKEIMLYKFWGISVIELMVKQGSFTYYSVPRKHILPKERKITYEQTGTDGLYYDKPPVSKYVAAIGKYNDLGLLLKAAPYVIYKRGGFGDWAHFAEIFGMPFREARYDGFNPAVKAQLEQALEQAGSAGYAVLPKEAELTFHESKSTQGSSELYNALIGACNKELSILILGQTETTTKTSGSLGGSNDSYDATEDAINMTDREDELAIMNEQVKPLLANLGYPVADGHFIHQEEDESLGIKEKVEVFIKLKKDYGLPMDDDYIYQETGIPKPADYAAQVGAKAQATAAETAKATPTAIGNKKPEKPPKKGDNTQEATLTWLEAFSAKMADFFDHAHKS